MDAGLFYNCSGKWVVCMGRGANIVGKTFVKKVAFLYDMELIQVYASSMELIEKRRRLFQIRDGRKGFSGVWDE